MKFYESMRISDAESLYRLKVQAEHQAALFSSIISAINSVDSSDDESKQVGTSTFTFYGPHWDETKPDEYIQWVVDLPGGFMAPLMGENVIDPDHSIERETINRMDENPVIERIMAYASDASGFNSVLARSADLIAANKFDPANIYSLVSSAGNNLGETTQDLCAMLTANSVGANNATSFLTSVMNYCKVDGNITQTDNGFKFTPSPGRVQTVCWAVIAQNIVDVATAVATVVSMASRVVGLLLGAIAFVGNFLIKITNDTVSDAAKFKMNPEADNCCFNSPWGSFTVNGHRLKQLFQYAIQEFLSGPDAPMPAGYMSNIAYLINHYGGVKVSFLSADIYIWLNDDSDVRILDLSTSTIDQLFYPEIYYNIEILPAYHFNLSDSGITSLMKYFNERGNINLWHKFVSNVDKYQAKIDPQFAQLLVREWFENETNVSNYITPAKWEEFDGDSSSYVGDSSEFRNALAVTGFYIYCALISAYSSEDVLKLSFNLRTDAERNKISDGSVYISALSDDYLDYPDNYIGISDDTNPIFAGLPIIVSGICRALDLADAYFTPVIGFFENSMLGANGKNITSPNTDLSFWSSGSKVSGVTWAESAIITIIMFSPGSVGPNLNVLLFGADRWDCRSMGVTTPLYSKGSPRFTIPQYTMQAIKGALIISAAVAATVCAAFVLVKVSTRRKVNKTLTSHRAASEKAWQTYKDNPTDENYAAYIQANKRYNRSASWLGGTCSSQTGYSTNESSSSGAVQGASSTGYKGSTLIANNPEETDVSFDFDTSSIESSLEHISGQITSSTTSIRDDVDYVNRNIAGKYGAIYKLITGSSPE